MTEKRFYTPTPEAMLHLLLQKAADYIFGGSIKAFVLKLAFFLQGAASHLLLLHLLPEVFEGQTGSHHLIDAAAESPPVHRRAVMLLPQNLRGHVAGRTSLTAHRGEEESRMRET